MAKVLLGTPNGEVLDLVTATLESFNHTVESSPSSVEFLNLAEQDTPDFFVLDDSIEPQPLLEILSLLPTTAEGDCLPVILLSETASDADTELVNMGVVAVVNKHIDGKEWVELLTRVFGEEAISE